MEKEVRRCRLLLDHEAPDRDLEDRTAKGEDDIHTDESRWSVMENGVNDLRRGGHGGDEVRVS